jgi:hypothetical protein
MIPLDHARTSPDPANLPVIANSVRLTGPVTGFPNTNFCLFTLLRTLLYFLAPTKNSTLLFPTISALFHENTEGCTLFRSNQLLQKLTTATFSLHYGIASTSAASASTATAR